MSEPRRWWVYQNEEFGSTHVCDFNQRGFVPNSFSIAVIEAEPVLARIKELESQLKEANAVAEFYGDRDNWTEGNPQKCCAMIGPDDHDAESYTAPYFAGSKARAYLEKWEEKK